MLVKKILILGASGTAGGTLAEYLSQYVDLAITGTYFSQASKKNTSVPMVQFGINHPENIESILECVHPDIVVSALRGDFENQLKTHKYIANYLLKHQGKIIFLSTANVFDADWTKPHYESDVQNSESEYGNFKIKCEKLLLDILQDRATIVRLPFVWGKDSPRLQEVRAGCGTGQLLLYDDFLSNHVTDLQIAQFVCWIIREHQSGIFHVGTSDIVEYRLFIEDLIEALGIKHPKFVLKKASGILAVLSERRDIPDHLQWNTGQVIEYLSNNQTR